METKKILIIDDDTDICLLLSKFLSKHGYKTETALSGKSALQLLTREKFDLIFCDFRLGDFDGKEMLAKIKDISPSTQVIIITGYSDIKVAVDIIKSGACDYVTKPLIPDEILMMAEKALNAQSMDADWNTNVSPTNKKTGSHTSLPQNAKMSEMKNKYIDGVSDEALELFKQVDLVANTPYSVIIYGESGTGKESIAKRIHEKSNRRNEAFVAVDCGSLSKELAASELFGHIKGSFTGAINDKIGHFEMAHKGTLFLDEVINLSYDIQVLLLRVIQERKLRRIGSNKEVEVDVRILIASNEKITDAVSRKRFREDLYHRFNEFTIHIAPLRDRNKDIMLFANHFLKLSNIELEKNIKGFSKEVIEIFNTYHWPGNLREMNNVIKRATLLSTGDYIELHTLPQEVIYPQKFSFNVDTSDDFHTKKPFVSVANDLKSAAQQAEHEMIMEVLQKVKYNRSKAAQILKIDRKTLYLKMKALNMLENE